MTADPADTFGPPFGHPDGERHGAGDGRLAVTRPRPLSFRWQKRRRGFKTFAAQKLDLRRQQRARSMWWQDQDRLRAAARRRRVPRYQSTVQHWLWFRVVRPLLWRWGVWTGDQENSERLGRLLLALSPRWFLRWFAG